MNNIAKKICLVIVFLVGFFGYLFLFPTRKNDDQAKKSYVSLLSNGQTSLSVSIEASQQKLEVLDDDTLISKLGKTSDNQKVNNSNSSYLSSDKFAYGGYVYSTLSSSEKINYRYLFYGLTHRVYASLSNIDDKGIEKLYQQIDDDHPELFYVNGLDSVKIRDKDDSIKYLIQGTYTQTVDQQNKTQKQIDDYTKPILDSVSTEDDFSKATYFVQTLVNDTKADDSNPESKQTIGSVFIQHNSVCAGYAKAFQYLCQKSGIECSKVSGKITNSDDYSKNLNHAWDLVKLDKTYYYVDPMWSDPDSSKSVVDFSYPWMIYDYCFVPKSDMDLSRTCKDIYNLPTCDSMNDNWYVRNGSYFSNYSASQCAAVLNRDINNGNHESSLRFASENVYNQAITDLINNQKIFTYVNVKNLLYIKNDSLHTITFLHK